MAAAQDLGGRFCGCGCGVSIDDRSTRAQYTAECALARREAQQRIKDRARSKSRNAEMRKKPNSVERTMNHKLASDPEREPNVVCKACQGQPWARRPDRMLDNGDIPVGVAIGQRGWVCRGCDELYAPEPRPELGPAIRSSAGIVADHGRLYGVEINHKGDGELGPGSMRKPPAEIKKAKG